MDIKNIVLGIAIMILTIFVVVYGNNLIFEKPEYDDFCGSVRTAKVIETQSECAAEGGVWEDHGYCNIYSGCEEEYDKAREKYYKKVFLVTLPLGIIIIAIGALVFGLEAVGAGLMGGGVATILYGVGGYWQYSADLMKFLLSLVGLVIVIYVAYWFNKKYHKK
ncbi:MAG: hypothetical protein PVJ67_00215 [Candidatus Pacearchaeota archaeon]|jgi:hypothetical protein